MPALAPLAQSDEIFVANDFATDLTKAGLDLASNIRRIRTGETLYVEGDAAPYCYQIIRGVVKEYNTLEDGRRQVTDFYGVGELFGISEQHEQLHTAEAITDCTFYSYPRDRFMHAVSSSPKLSQCFVDTLMVRLHRARKRIVMLGRMTAMQRVTSFLLRLSEEQQTCDDIHLQMSRQDIADHLGLTIETVCRVLTELKKRGLVVMPSARLFSISDCETLCDASQGHKKLH